MEPITQAYSPSQEELKFFTEEQAVRYARDAGFTVQKENGNTVATRGDMPDTHCVLDNDGYKYSWIRKS